MPPMRDVVVIVISAVAGKDAIRKGDERVFTESRPEPEEAVVEPEPAGS